MLFRPLFLGILLLVFAAPAGADIVVLADGELLVGSVERKDGQIVFQGQGREPAVLTDVARVESQPQVFLGRRLRIIMADNSVIRGTLADWEGDLGVFIETPAGTLRLAFQNIGQIFLDDEAPPEEEKPSSASAGFGLVLPLGAPLFGLSWAPMASVETRWPQTAWVLGARSEYLILNYLPSSEVDYRIVNLSLTLKAKILSLTSRRDLARPLSPYVKLGTGAGLITVTDRRADARNKNYGSLNFQSSLEGGVDWSLDRTWFVAGACGVTAVVDGSSLFWLTTAGISLRYGF